jgi:glycosyltransferase involved in cell wall biosynthesis
MAVDFSIIIPTFRRPAQLRAALESVLAQDGVNIEVFVVDDSPEGSAREVVESLADSRVAYRKTPEPTGGRPSVVRNLALPEAKGEYLHFLDDDDLVPEGHYLRAKKAFLDHPDVGMVFGRIEPFGDCSAEQLAQERLYFSNAWRNAAAWRRIGTRWGFVSEMLFGSTLLVCSAAIVRRACAVRLNGFDPTIRLMEDADFNTRMMREFGALHLDDVVLNYRIGSPSLMHDPHPDGVQLAREREGRRLSRDRYRRERGSVEYYGLAALFVLNSFRRRSANWMAKRANPKQGG